MALSTNKAEYIALSEVVKVWIKELLKELGFEQKCVSILCDFQSEICLAKNRVYHEMTKHVATKYHYIRDWIVCGDVEVLKIPTSINAADVLTKFVPMSKFNNTLEFLKVTEACFQLLTQGGVCWI